MLAMCDMFQARDIPNLPQKSRSVKAEAYQITSNLVSG
jgi:hypothetical protein